MKIRHLGPLTVALAIAMSTSALFADVKSQERTQVRFEGGLGKVVNFFGGRAAREGVVNTVAVRGDRMMSASDTTGEIVDLREEKVYQLDMKKKTYSVVTFAELRKQMEDAMARAKQQAEAARQEPQRQSDAEKGQPQKEYEVDFSVKETGRTRPIAGYDTKESIVTVIVREKGRTLEEAGGMVMDTSLWLAPEIASLKELQDFRLRYARQVYGTMMAEAAPDMTQAMAMYPMMKDAMAKYQAEGKNLSGTPLSTEMRFQVQAPPQSAEDQKQAESSKQNDPPPTSVGGLLGGFGRRMAKKKPEENRAEPNAVPGRATIMTTTLETLQLATTVTDGDVALPAGFKQK
jgi:hypothetical protein